MSGRRTPRPCPDCGDPFEPVKRDRGWTTRCDSCARRSSDEPIGNLRRSVWRLDNGRCVMCQRSVSVDASRWVWQAHHPIPQQVLRRHDAQLCGDPDLAVLACTDCHAAHESGSRRIPRSKLPERVRCAAAALGGWAAAALERRHP